MWISTVWLLHALLFLAVAAISLAGCSGKKEEAKSKGTKKGQGTPRPCIAKKKEEKKGDATAKKVLAKWIKKRLPSYEHFSTDKLSTKIEDTVVLPQPVMPAAPMASDTAVLGMPLLPENSKHGHNFGVDEFVYKGQIMTLSRMELLSPPKDSKKESSGKEEYSVKFDRIGNKVYAIRHANEQEDNSDGLSLDVTEKSTEDSDKSTKSSRELSE